jgi:hypothetical protein
VIVKSEKNNPGSNTQERDCRGVSRAQLGLFLALAERKRRDPARRAILILIRALAAMLAPDQVLLPGQMREIGRLSSQIAALAHCCDLADLAEASQRLCEAPEQAVAAQIRLLCELARKV